MVVIDPVDASEGVGERIDGERGSDGAEAGESILVRDLELEHHDGDDDRDDAIGEGFEAGWGWLVGHKCREEGRGNRE